jgi:hypothetical protein
MPLRVIEERKRRKCQAPEWSAPALYRIEAILGPGSGVKILGSPATSSFLDSVGCGEQES